MHSTDPVNRVMSEQVLTLGPGNDPLLKYLRGHAVDRGDPVRWPRLGSPSLDPYCRAGMLGPRLIF
jgi:hypothetical protein